MDYGFELDPGETILRVVHRRWVDLVPSVTMAIVFVLVAAGLAFMAGRFPDNLPFPPILVLALVVILALLGALILLIGIYTFEHNVLVFTNIHLVEIEQPSLFGRRISQLGFNRVQDVSAVQVGVLHTLLNFGNVEIQFAGEKEKFIFLRAPDPERLADDALQWRDQCLRLHAGSSVDPAAAPEAESE